MQEVIHPYSSLKHINEMKFVNMNDKVDLIKRILIKYNVEKELGVFRLHKHFQLQKDENLLWEQTKQNTYESKVVTNIQGSVYAVRFNLQTKQWIPLEYQTVRQNIWESILTRQDFEDLSKEITDIIGNQTEIYGLGVNFRNKGRMLEETNKQKRTQVVFQRQSEVNPNDTETKYFVCQCYTHQIQKELKKKCGSFCVVCCSHCSNHCNSHCTSH